MNTNSNMIKTKKICPVCGKVVNNLNQHISMMSKSCKAHDAYQYGRLESCFNSESSLSEISTLLGIERHSLTKLFKLYFGNNKTVGRNEFNRRNSISNKKSGKSNTRTKTSISYETIKKSFEVEGYKLLSTEYINNRQKLKYVCKNGHRGEINWTKWRIGQRCAKCSKYRNRYNINYIKKSFESEGYLLLSDTYIDSETPLDFICPNGHKHAISWSAWNNQHQRCAICAGVSRTSYEQIKSSFEKEGYELLTKVYINNRQKLDFICPNSHKCSITWSAWSKGGRCKICSGLYIDEDVVIKDVTSNGYILIGKYTNSHIPMHLICPNGHDYYVSWHNWSSKGYRCPRCTNVGTSYQETDLLSCIKSIYDGEIIDRSKTIISPYELDIVIPDKKIAIEYCGLYWHSELSGKDRKYHLSKLELCNEKGYRLITIFEDEWLSNKDLVISRLKNILSLDNERIYARQCTVKEITVTEAKKFCNENHLQGYNGSNIKLGLFYNDELVSVMTFSKPSISKGGKNRNRNIWELQRFCSKRGITVVGGASKLLKYFERTYDWIQIFSYADRRWSNGNLYEKLGFDFDKYTVLNYWYFKSNKLERIHRFALRKQPYESKNKTEWELRQDEGYNRIWDCGNIKYIKYKNNIKDK